MSQFFGRVKIRLNGDVIESQPGATLDVGGFEATPVVNDNSMGHTETPKHSTMSFNVGLKRGDSIEPYRRIRDAVAVFECDTGQSYIIKNCFNGPTPTISSNGGSVAITLHGDPAQEMVQ